MFGELLIRFAIALYHFFCAFFKGAEYFFRSAVFLKLTFDHKKIGIVFYVLGGHGIKVAFPKTQVVNCIQNIGLSHTVIAHQTIDHRVEIQCFGIKIFVID